MRIMASHSDSPSFKIKENPEIEVEKQYIKLNVERYGGMIFAPWFDRPLSVAGRLILKNPSTGKLESKLVNVDRDLVMMCLSTIFSDTISSYITENLPASGEPMRNSFPLRNSMICNVHFHP